MPRGQPAFERAVAAAAARAVADAISLPRRRRETTTQVLAMASCTALGCSLAGTCEAFGLEDPCALERVSCDETDAGFFYSFTVGRRGAARRGAPDGASPRRAARVPSPQA